MGKKAVLIGCNYPGTKAELKGCINDVKRMHRCLIDRFEFREQDITLLIDTDSDYDQPNGANIRRAISRLIGSAQPGDSLFLHYSGHGTRLPVPNGDDDDTGYDECIVPCDMNLITDDDFREFVNKVPKDCRITIVSDSCHSGGLIDDAKEQIGESTKSSGHHSSTGFSISGFLKTKVEDAFETRGIYIPHRGRRDGEHEEAEESEGIKNRSLPLSTLIDILKQKTGNDDIDSGKVRPALFNLFGEDTSPTFKNFMRSLLSQLHENSSGGLMSMVGGLAQEFIAQKLDSGTDDSPEMNKKNGLPDTGILISGCQTNQTSADATPPGKPLEAYGALSDAIERILKETDGEISNRDLVKKARKMLSREGFSQRPGLYCCDDHVDAPFIC